MKIRILAIIAVLICFAPHPARAQQVYTISTVSINSTTVPVSVIPVTGPKAEWRISLRAAGTNPILCFPYTGTLPASAPANCSSPGAGSGCEEVSATVPISDFSNFYSASNPGYQTAFGSGWACVLETGSAETAAGRYR